MNVHYKILTKILATQINGVHHTIIHPDQKGFVSGRYIGENIIEIISIADKQEFEDNPGLLVSVEFNKAFDTLEWSSIMKAFEYFNFPEYLIKGTSATYNIDGQTINNRHMSKGFIVTRGLDKSAHCPHVFLSLQ